MPNIKAKEKYCKVAPPKKKIAEATNNVVREWFIWRVNVCLMMISTVSSKSSPLSKRFYLILSKTTTVLFIEYPNTAKRAVITGIVISTLYNLPKTVNTPTGIKIS